MGRFFWKIGWKLSGWKFKGSYPYDIKKMVLIAAPHTSWKDVIIGLAARSVLRITHIRFLGKKELFDGPFGWIFRWQGGIPVDRFSKTGAVDQAVQLFNTNECFSLALAPEGTRKKVDRLRTGFYNIAKKAEVPILMIGLDFANKQMIFAEPFFTTDNEADDFLHIFSFFGPIKGRYPESGLAHLLQKN